MQPINTLDIYPTSRSIRLNLTNYLNQNQVLPKMITIGEFEKKALLTPNRVFIDDDTRVILLKEASNFSNFSELKIDREFFAFLKNSKFIFSFFDELSIELVDIKKLYDVDVYATFSEHIEILDHLKNRYIELLDKYGYCDKINLPAIYKLNQPYIKSFDKIKLHLEGYLNSFELKLFKQISNLTTLEIELITNRYNQKMIERLSNFGFELKLNRKYTLNLSNNSITEEKKLQKPTTIYNLFSSNSRVLQVAYIKKSVYDFIERGIDPKNIAVIVPDSGFCDFIELFDSENSFNFSMGKSFTKELLYRRVLAFYNYAIEKNVENFYRLTRLGYTKETIEDIYKNFSQTLDEKSMISLFEKFYENLDGEAVELYKKELYLFSKLFKFLKYQKFSNVVQLFINRLKKLTIDDVGGGNITVMEILESRGVGFDGVIVVDFNDHLVPTKNQKDMFLSSDIRALANLPTKSDRENLQKYYYKRLFDRAKMVNISYLEDEQNSPSRFIDELEIVATNDEFDLANYHDILFNPQPKISHFTRDDLILEYDFKKVKISSTSFKIFSQCKRRYYYQYIRKLEEASIPKEESDERIVGLYIHDALKKFYSNHDTLRDEEELYLFLQKELYIRSESDLVLRFHIDNWLERLKLFCKKEVEYFKEGYRVYECEKSLDTNFMGFNLTGKIDRIDIKDDKFYLLDYKSGKISKTTKKALEDGKVTDFQLQFYTILVSTLGEVADANYYDLANAKIVNDDFFEEKMLLLEKSLKELDHKEINFKMCDDLNSCRFCPYIKICGRGL